MLGPQCRRGSGNAPPGATVPPRPTVPHGQGSPAGLGASDGDSPVGASLAREGEQR